MTTRSGTASRKAGAGMSEQRMPKYVARERSAWGQVRYYFRRGEQNKVRLPEEFWCGATIWVRILRRSEEPYWRSRLVDDCRGATRLQGVF